MASPAEAGWRGNCPLPHCLGTSHLKLSCRKQAFSTEDHFTQGHASSSLPLLWPPHKLRIWVTSVMTRTAILGLHRRHLKTKAKSSVAQSTYPLGSRCVVLSQEQGLYRPYISASRALDVFPFLPMFYPVEWSCSKSSRIPSVYSLIQSCSFTKCMALFITHWCVVISRSYFIP